MENFSYHVPFYVVTGGVKASGHSSDLNAGAVGLYDRATFSVATSVGNGKEFFFAQGNTGGKDWYGQSVTETHKSPFFYGKDVTNMYVSLPQTIQNEEWVIGFNGAASSNSLSFEKGKATRVKLYFHGQPIYRFFGGPKEYVISYTPTEDCTTPCTEDDCPEGISDCLTHTQALIDKINTHTELKKFGVVAKLVDPDFVAATTNMIKWCLSVCDNGDALALQAVQAQAPAGVTVTRSGRDGATSTYTFCKADTEETPAAFTQSGDVLLAVCGECEGGATLTEGQDVYIVTRPLAGSEDLNDNTARQTYADLVGTAYETSEAITFNGATAVEVVAASDAITLTAHGLQTGNKITYADGGGTQIVGLTDGSDYFVIKMTDDIIKLATTAANAYAGTAIAIADGVGAAHTITPVITAKFMGIVGGVAQVKLKVGEGVALEAQLADALAFSNTEAAKCTYADADTIAWTNCGAGISSRRTMKINALQRPDCDAAGDRLEDLEAVLSGVIGIDLTTLTKIAGTACADDYTVEQDSVDCLDEGCLTSNVTFNYDDLPAFENHSWYLVPETVVEDATRECGIRISAGYIDPKFGNCSFLPTDYYETMPIKMEVSLLGEDDSACDVANWPSVQQTKIGRIGRQSGEYVVREVLMKTQAYLKHVSQFSIDSRDREAFDMNLLNSVDRNAFYKLYYVSFGASYGVSTWRKNEQEKFTAVFAFKEGDAAAATFESTILDVLTVKSGVTLHVNN